MIIGNFCIHGPCLYMFLFDFCWNFLASCSRSIYDGAASLYMLQIANSNLFQRKSLSLFLSLVIGGHFQSVIFDLFEGSC